LSVVIVPLTINSNRVDRSTVRQTNVKAVADRWATAADWTVLGVTVTGDQVFVDVTGPNPAPDLAALRTNLDAAGLGRLDVRVSVVPNTYMPVPK
jgi:hypothetical protein